MKVHCSGKDSQTHVLISTSGERRVGHKNLKEAINYLPVTLYKKTGNFLTLNSG